MLKTISNLAAGILLLLLPLLITEEPAEPVDNSGPLWDPPAEQDFSEHQPIINQPKF